MNIYANFFKRPFDFIVSFIAIIILSPVIIILYLVLLISNKSNPLFFQDRPGKYEKRIRIIKFKSMTDKRDSNDNLLPDIERLTQSGIFCRKYSLDELPQLVNVLKGDMSLIGPRPLLFKYLPLYNEHQKGRHKVRPGITGWAQVNGRNSISWQEKFNCDIYYIDNLTFLLDIKILWLTFQKVFKKEGINQSDERPMQPFTGEK